MKKGPIIGIVALVFIIISILWYTTKSDLRGAPIQAAVATTSAVPTLGPYVERAQYYDITANYPTKTPLTGNADDTALEQIRGWISATVARFKIYGNFANLTPQDIQTLGLNEGKRYALQITYLISSSPHTISYIFTQYEDTGGAHGNTFFKTFTFDINIGALLSLSDLFFPNADYLVVLSQLARMKLPSIIGTSADIQMIAQGTLPQEKKFADFFIDNSTLDILFPPYAVASYADGPQTLQIPLSSFSNILKGEYRP